MALNTDYSEKFDGFARQYGLYRELPEPTRRFIREKAERYRFTFQEFRQVVEASRDLAMWGEPGLPQWWAAQPLPPGHSQLPAQKQFYLERLKQHLRTLRSAPKTYRADGAFRPKKREKAHIDVDQADKKIHGMCPVASPKTVCCNLRTIDAVENCIFGCSYCSIQTFYSDKIVFHENLPEKLAKIDLEPDRFYHFGTGQASDSLAWGNRNGNLEELCRFAEQHPNILLEFKTKSNNIRYFLEHPAPANIVCSWSMNTDKVIANEEHFTASLEQRLEAARQVADRGIKVAFHFHPLVYYRDWQEEYPQIAQRILREFRPEEVLFISFGSVTLIKPVIRKVRRLGYPSKILQMEMVPDPHGKFTYPDHIKIEMFRTMFQAFAPWHEQVFFYLCMEKAEIWEEVFGWAYPTNEEFEEEFGRSVTAKLAAVPDPHEK